MRVVIAGAGNVGRSIAAELVGNDHEVLLIDKEADTIRPSSIPGAEWLEGDACEIELLEKAGLPSCQVVVAATGDDKANLVLSLLAKTEYGVPRVVARVNHPKNEWMFNEAWGVDVAVSTPRMLSALVEEAVSIGDLVRLFTFRQGGANLVELTLPPSSPSRRAAGSQRSRGRPTRSWSRSCATAGSSPPRLTTRSRPATSCCSWRPRTSSRCSRTCCRRTCTAPRGPEARGQSAAGSASAVGVSTGSGSRTGCVDRRMSQVTAQTRTKSGMPSSMLANPRRVTWSRS